MPVVGTEAGKSSRRHPPLSTAFWLLPPVTFCWMLWMLDFMALICCFCLLLAIFSFTFATWYINKLTHLKPIEQLWLILPQASTEKHIHNRLSPFLYLQRSEAYSIPYCYRIFSYQVNFIWVWGQKWILIPKK